MIYNFNEVIDRRGTFCTQWDYMEDRFGEKDLLPFSISDTDFKAPDPIIQKLKQVADHGIYGYSRWNHETFKHAIVSYFAGRHQSEVRYDWVVYSPSVLYSIAVLFRLLSQKKDRILVFEPMYDAFYRVIQDNDRTLVSLKLEKEGDQYGIPFDKFERLVKDCSIFLLCSPHNPTGRVWTAKELDHMAAICKKYGVAMISDEIHSDMVLGAHTHHTLLNYLDRYHQIYLVSSASKTFNTPGLSGSYCILPDPKVREQFMSRLRYEDFLNSVSLMGMHALITGYEECMDYVDQLKEYIQANMVSLSNYVQSDLSRYGVSFVMPQATYLAWIHTGRVKGDSSSIQAALIHTGKVGIMPGKTYGDENYLRMNLGCPSVKLKDGLKRMKQAFESM